MNTSIPSVDDIRAQLAALPLTQLDRLAGLSGVPLPTLTKIRYGQTLNPGIETVRMFAPHLASISAELIGQPGAPAVEGGRAMQREAVLPIQRCEYGNGRVVVPVSADCLVCTLRPGQAAWPCDVVQREMQAGGISRRRAKKVLSARVRRQLRYATTTLAGGGVRLMLMTPGRRRRIDLMPFECRSLAELLSREGQ